MKNAFDFTSGPAEPPPLPRAKKTKSNGLILGLVVGGIAVVLLMVGIGVAAWWKHEREQEILRGVLDSYFKISLSSVYTNHNYYWRNYQRHIPGIKDKSGDLMAESEAQLLNLRAKYSLNKVPTIGDYDLELPGKLTIEERTFKKTIENNYEMAVLEARKIEQSDLSEIEKDRRIKAIIHESLMFSFKTLRPIATLCKVGNVSLF